MDKKDWYAFGVVFLFMFIGVALLMEASLECSMVRCNEPDTFIASLFLLAGLLFAFTWTLREELEKKWKNQK